jgi:membrane-associated phospholipid phosphatase
LTPEPGSLKGLSILEQVALALSLILLSLLLVDSFMLERAGALPPDIRAFFRAITDIGRSGWMLLLTGAGFAVALVLRRRHPDLKSAAAYGLIANAFAFVFLSVAGTALIANLAKAIIGRARPVLFDAVGGLEFKLFAFEAEYASLPSGHAANSFALATAIAMLCPKARVLLYILAAWIAASRVLIGEHYVTDILLGAALGTAFPSFLRGSFAARRLLFERTREGDYRLRGAGLRRWLAGNSRPREGSGI